MIYPHAFGDADTVMVHGSGGPRGFDQPRLEPESCDDEGNAITTDLPLPAVGSEFSPAIEAPSLHPVKVTPERHGQSNFDRRLTPRLMRLSAVATRDYQARSLDEGKWNDQHVPGGKQTTCGRHLLHRLLVTSRTAVGACPELAGLACRE